MGNKMKFTIPAEIFSDDRIYSVTFDALPWFHQARDEDILALAYKGWGGCDLADDVAYAAAPHDDRVADVLEYCRLRSSSGEPIGFEVHVDQQAAKQWLEAHRGYLLDLIEAGVADEDGYWELIDSIWQEAKRRFQDSGAPQRLEAAATSHGLRLDGPEDLSCDSRYTWHWFVERDGDRIASVEFELYPSLGHDETLAGLNFGVSAVSADGVILYDLAPYNYTPQCWVSVADSRAVWTRLDDLLDCVCFDEVVRRCVKEVAER